MGVGDRPPALRQGWDDAGAGTGPGVAGAVLQTTLSSHCAGEHSHLQLLPPAVAPGVHARVHTLTLTCTCTHTVSTPIRSHAGTLTHTSYTHTGPRTHLELIADLVLFDAGRFFPLDTEVPGGEDLGTERRPVVLAQEQLLGQPLHHPGGAGGQGLWGRGAPACQPASAGAEPWVWGGKPLAVPGAGFGLSLGLGGGWGNRGSGPCP